VRQKQQTEADRGFDISKGELAERFIFALVTGIGINLLSVLLIAKPLANLLHLLPKLLELRAAALKDRELLSELGLAHFLMAAGVEAFMRRNAG